MSERQSLDNSSNELTPQELRLVDCATRGEAWTPSKINGRQTDFDPANAKTWDAGRTIRAEVILCLITGDIWPGKGGPWPISTKGVLVVGARVTGTLDLEGAILERRLGLHQCVFDQPVKFTDAETRTLSFRCSHLLGGLLADRANISGSLHLNDGFVAKGIVALGGVKIEGELLCDGGSFESTDGSALNGSGMIVGGNVFFRDGFRARGKVDLIGMDIGGQLDCTKGSFENANGDALNGNGITVGKSVFLRDGFSANGMVDLGSAKIGDQLGCRGGRFENADGTALKGNGMTVDAGVLLSNGFTATGMVDLGSAKIEGQLVCAGGSFENANGDALNGYGMSVGADVFLSDGFNANGQVNFRRAEIHGNLLCRHSTFANPDGDALDLTLAEIGAGFFLHGLKLPKDGSSRLDGRLVLEQAKCRTYCDDRESWPEPGKLVLDGFVYERFQDCDTSWRYRREWLQRQTEDHLDGVFHPQPWTQAIKVLREMGHDSDAKELAVCREIARAKSKNTKLHIKIWYYLLRLVVGNGYKPERALYWSAGFVLIGWLVFATAGSLSYMAPRDGNVRVSREWNETMVLPRTYPPFNGLVYALDAYLPVIEFDQDEMWEPSTKKTIQTVYAAPDIVLRDWLPWWLTLPDAFFTAGWHRVLYWIEEVAGWVLVSLFIAGMSGVMKKE